MDLDLILNSFPKLLSASIITLKLLSISLIIGMFIGLFFAILRIKHNFWKNCLCIFLYFSGHTFIGTNIYNLLWFWSG